MTLPDLDPDPLPSEDDLKPFLGTKSGREDVARQLAGIRWRMETRERDPDTFLVPFSNDAFPTLGFRSYQQYLASPRWRLIKAQELRKAGGKCAACGEDTRTIHHRDYRPRVLRGEDRAALVALCQPCHNSVHYAAKRQERSWNESERVLFQMITGKAVLC